jgi:hypothetical protein
MITQEEVDKLYAEIQYHRDKWHEYEWKYILPLFEIAKKDGWDLRKLVHDNPGKNCVILFVEKIMAERNDALNKEIEMRRQLLEYKNK